MTTTSNYQLNQWSATDQVKRTDFNSDNQKIDAALAAMPKLAYGSYVGNGKCGQSNPNSLTFSFQPKLVIITQKQSSFSSNYIIAIRGQTEICDMDSNGGFHPNTCTWTQKGLSWYNANNVEYQFNASGTTYYYIAIG